VYTGTMRTKFTTAVLQDSLCVGTENSPSVLDAPGVCDCVKRMKWGTGTYVGK